MTWAAITNTMLYSEADLSTWGALLGSVGFPVVVGFFLIYKAIPDIISRFIVEQTATRDAFINEQKETREHFDRKGEMRSNENRESIAAVLLHAEKESLRHDERFKTDMAIVNRSLEAHGEVLEEVRDALRLLKGNTV